MEDVNELLKTWELENLIPVFNKQQITIQALSALTDDDIKELIPLTGPRSLFMRCWRAWKAEFSSTLLDFSLFDNLSNDIIVIQDSVNKDKENLPPIRQSDSEEASSQCMKLENLLKESLESASLLACKGRALTGDSARNLLAGVIAKVILTENKSPINGAIYYKWANYIKELFPGERTSTYYIPACTTANGIVLQAKGKLVHQVLNKRRRLQSLGALPKGKGKRSREESPTYSLGSNPSPRPLPSIFSIEEENTDNIKEDLQWLKNSSEPWSLVDEKWEITHKARTRFLYDSNNDTIEKYFETYPALRKPHGYFLLLKDFNAINEAYKDNLFINFPLLKSKLQELLQRKKTTDPFYHELITLTNSSNEETSNLAGFLSIPFLLNTASVKNKKKRSSQTDCSWKPSKAEVREGFIGHIKSSAELTRAVELRLSTLQKKGLSSQPYIIVVGESLAKVNTYLIVANRLVIYETQTIMHAVDTCYKIIWALNLEYGTDTYPVWYFLQKGLYKMTSTFDKGSTATESLLTDCDV